MFQILISKESLLEALRLRVAFFARLEQPTFCGLNVQAEIERLHTVEAEITG